MLLLGKGCIYKVGFAFVQARAAIAEVGQLFDAFPTDLELVENQRCKMMQTACASCFRSSEMKQKVSLISSSGWQKYVTTG